jgi:HPt (histidine-containing phosphotransfer) domain-containing protein
VSADAPVLDPAAVVRLQRLGGDKLLREMVRLYLENSQERLAQIDTGLAEGGALDETRRGAHSLKSSAANVGALRVSAAASELEAAAEAGDRETARSLRSHLREASEDARRKLDELVEELA